MWKVTDKNTVEHIESGAKFRFNGAAWSLVRADRPLFKSWHMRTHPRIEFSNRVVFSAELECSIWCCDRHPLAQ